MCFPRDCASRKRKLSFPRQLLTLDMRCAGLASVLAQPAASICRETASSRRTVEEGACCDMGARVGCASMPGAFTASLSLSPGLKYFEGKSIGPCCNSSAKAVREATIDHHGRLQPLRPQLDAKGPPRRRPQRHGERTWPSPCNAHGSLCRAQPAIGAIVLSSHPSLARHRSCCFPGLAG